MLCSVAYDDSKDKLHLLGTNPVPLLPLGELFAAKAWYPIPNANTSNVYNPTLVNEKTKSPKIGVDKLVNGVVSNCSKGDKATMLI